MPDSIHNGHRERIREQYISHGAEAFLDHQFLELLLTYAIPRRDTNELAHLLLERFGSLEGVVTAEIAQLMLVEGVGESAAVFLRMQGDLFRRLRMRRLTDARGQIRLSSPVDAARYAVSQLSLQYVRNGTRRLPEREKSGAELRKNARRIAYRSADLSAQHCGGRRCSHARTAFCSSITTRPAILPPRSRTPRRPSPSAPRLRASACSCLTISSSAANSRTAFPPER